MGNLGKRVLIVEDHRPSCELLARHLARVGMTTECAATFKEGVDKAREAKRNGAPFDRVLLDLMLPDSEEPLGTLRRSHELGARIIPITGSDDPRIVRECRDRELAYILKGTTAAGIIRAVLTDIEWENPSKEIESAIMRYGKPQRFISSSAGILNGMNGWKKAAVIVGVIGGVLTITGAIATGSIYVYTHAKGTGANELANSHSLQRLSERITSETTKREELLRDEAGTRAEADKKLLEVIAAIQNELRKQGDELAAQRVVDQKSEDERNFFREQQVELRKMQVEDRREMMALIHRMDDKLNRILEVKK